jgi:hypothetical protein
MKQVVLLISIIFGMGIGGCSTLEINPSNHARLASGKYVHIPLISRDEDKLMREATERATVLHSQIRAFDIANQVIENRILQLVGGPQKQLTARTRAVTKSQNAVDLAKLSRIDVKFSKGSFELDKKSVLELSKALSGGTFTFEANAKEQQSLMVLQVATHRKNGLDSINSRRLGAIHELLKSHNIPLDFVKLKVIRVSNGTLDSKTESNASRTIQLSSVRAVS